MSVPLKVPKTKSTRVQLPYAASTDEPTRAEPGTLSYDPTTDTVRVQTSTGWEDVGGGGAGTVTTVSPGTGIAVTNPAGPIVTVSTDLAAGSGISITGTNPQTIASTGAPPSGTAGGDLSGTYPNPNVAAIHETSGPTQLVIGSVSNGELLRRVSGTLIGVGAGSLNIAGQVTGTLATTAVVAVTETSGPTALTIGAIADGKLLIRSGSTVIGTYSASQYYGNPFIEPPATPGTYDDEFEGGSADLATRGWLVKNAANATMSRVGDISPWSVSAASLTSTQYLSTIYGSQIMIQLSPGGYMSCTKAVAGGFASGSNATIWARMGNPVYAATVTTVAYSCRVFATYASAGNPDLTNFIYTQSYTSGATNVHTTSYGRTSGGANTDTAKSTNITVQDILGVRLKSLTANWSSFSADSATGTTTSIDQNAPTSTSIGFVGFSLDDIATGTGAPNSYTSRIYTVDFVRSATGANAWIGQTPRTRYMLT